MKKILLSTVALLSLSAGALAADLPARRAAPAPFVAAVPAFTWTGFYFGVNAGYGWSDNEHDDTILLVPGTTGAGGRQGTVVFDERHGDADGFTGGAQIGFNYQFTPGSGFVVGIEADIQAIDLNRDNGVGTSAVFFPTVGGAFPTTGAGAAFFFREDAASLDWWGSVRGRLGYAFDRVLVYGTGGFAYGNGDRHNGCGDFALANGFSAATCSSLGDDTRWGYAVGGGVEWALPMTASLFGSSAVTFKIEGLYVNLDEDGDRDSLRTVGFRGDGTPITGVRGSGDDLDFAVVRAGINFKF